MHSGCQRKWIVEDVRGDIITVIGVECRYLENASQIGAATIAMQCNVMQCIAGKLFITITLCGWVIVEQIDQNYP